MERRPLVQKYPVQILTPSLQIAGHLEIIGTPLTFLSDPGRDGMVLHDVRVVPLASGGPFKGLTQPLVTIRRQEIMLLYFSDPEARAAVQTLARKEQIIAYTSLAILRGAFHMPAESLITNFLATTSGDFLPLTEARVFLLTPLPVPYPDRCELLLVGRKYIQMYHPA